MSRPPTSRSATTNASSNPAKRKLLVPSSRGTPSVSSPAGSGRIPFGSTKDQGFGDELYQTGIKDESGRIKEYWSEDDACPLCKTDRHTNPRLRLLISPCYHKLCESCVDKLFTLGAETCPADGCNRVIRKTNFIHQTFESLEVEKEVAIRKRIAGIYNKTRKDFETDRQYDDYLEEIEDITFNLIEGIDRPATEARIQAYIAENAAITSARAREAAEEAENLRALEEYEALERQKKMEEAIKEEEEELKEHDEENKEIMKALEEAVRKSGGRDVDADRIVRRIRERRRKEREQAEKEAAAQTAQRRRLPARRQPIADEDEKYTAHAPTSPSYEGPYVPLPYSEPWEPHLIGGGAMLLPEDEYVDVDPAAKAIKAEGGAGKYRGGGFSLAEVWRRDMSLALDSLCIDAAT